MSLPSNSSGAFMRRASEGEDLWVLGGLYSYRARPGETGAYLACDVQGPDGFASPVHSHDDEEEGFYVARGEVTILLAGGEQRLGAGGFAFAPHGVEHAFRFEGPDAILLLLITPGQRHEALFRAMGERAASHVIPSPPEGQPDPGAMAELAARHGTRIMGPPPLR
jgi:quercetin dioxygenase-like cupin family protein